MGWVGIAFTNVSPEDRQGHNPPRCSSQPLRFRQPRKKVVYHIIHRPHQSYFENIQNEDRLIKADLSGTPGSAILTASLCASTIGWALEILALFFVWLHPLMAKFFQALVAICICKVVVSDDIKSHHKLMMTTKCILPGKRRGTRRTFQWHSGTLEGKC